MEKTAVKPGKVCRSPASRWGRASEAPFNTVLGIPGAVFLFFRAFLTAVVVDRPLGLFDRSPASARLRNKRHLVVADIPSVSKWVRR